MSERLIGSYDDALYFTLVHMILFNYFLNVPSCNEQTDGQTYRHTTKAYIALV